MLCSQSRHTLTRSIGEDFHSQVGDGPAGKQHDDLKKRTMDKTLETTLKVSINMTLPTCDDKGVFTDDDDTYRKHK